MYQTTTGLVCGLLIGVCAVFPAAADDGRAKAQVCTACHGPDGNSVNPEWPNLAGQHAAYLLAQTQAFKTGARTNANMNAMAAPLSDQDMADIAAYFSAQAPKIASVDAAEVSAGETLYRGGNKETGVPACMACHAPNGVGNPGIGYPALHGQHAKYVSLQLRAYRTGERATDAGEIMRTIAARMSDQDIENVAKYIQGLH